jgi:hypothetical protein
MKIGMENGIIRFVIDTTRLAYLLHENGYCNHRLAQDFHNQTAGFAVWLLDILFRDAPLPTQPWFVLRGLLQKGPAHLLGVFP